MNKKISLKNLLFKICELTLIEFEVVSNFPPGSVTQTENNPTLQQTNASSCRSAPNVAVHPVAVHPVAIEAVGNNNGVEAVDLAHPEIEIVTVDAVAKTQTKTKTKTKGAGATSPGTRTAFTGTKIVLNANRIVEEN